MKTPHLNTIDRSPLRLAFIVIPLVLACFALSPAPAQAQFCGNGCFFDNTWQGHDALMSFTPNVTFVFRSTAFGDSALKNTTDSSDNTAIGYQALLNDTDGLANTAIGGQALQENTTGSYNTATGDIALANNTTGDDNTATGVDALFGNTTGEENTATGVSALAENTTGSENTATGKNALLLCTTGSFNTATGFEALRGTFEESTGSYNTANGYQALFLNTTGGSNTANGVVALLSNTTGSFNAANGANALQSNTAGGGNVANGGFALASNTTGSNNVAEGFDALFHNTGSGNIGIGLAAGVNLTTGSNNIDIGNDGVAGESGTIRIGTQGGRVGGQTRIFVAGINGVSVRGTPVFVNADGQLGTTPSSRRFKTEIKPMDKASEAILALEPVTFRYKKELDPDGIPQFGLVAEEVEKVNPALITRDADGKPYTVRYEAVNAMLLNEFLKEHRQVQEQRAMIVHLKQDFQSKLSEQQRQIDVLTAGLQKVSDQLKSTQLGPLTVSND